MRSATSQSMDTTDADASSAVIRRTTSRDEPQADAAVANSSGISSLPPTTPSYPHQHHQHQHQHHPLHAELGFAVTTAILLSDWDKFGLTERVCYHFSISDALISAASTEKKEADQDDNTTESAITSNTGGGVARLLECVPTKQWHKLTRRQKRQLRTAIQAFNQEQQPPPSSSAVPAAANSNTPNKNHDTTKFLPLKLNPQTRVFFAYETTRIAVCLDASPTLTSTFGFASNDDMAVCCPMDRFIEMSKTFWTSIVMPIATVDTVWKPEIAVSVLAVFPRAMTATTTSAKATTTSTTSTSSHTNVLVRDFRVTDHASAELLAQKIQEWCHTVVESELARRLAHHAAARYHEIPLHASSLRDLLDAGAAALSTLSSAARPALVVATDSRSVACDGIIDIVTDVTSMRDVDTPVTVLDLSSPTSHLHHQTQSEEDNAGDDDFHLLSHDPVGAMFPLHLSDDSEAVYRVCTATGGSFFDHELLELAATDARGVSPQ